MKKTMKKKIHFICLLLLLLSLSVGGIRVEATSFVSQSHKSKITVYLVGDSTVSTYDSSVAPRAGWGQVFEEEFRHKVTVRNEAQSGRSSKSFIDEGRLDAVLGEIQKGDYLLIQFGHNDEKIEDPSRYTEPSTTYKRYLKQYIDGAHAKKATPILITPVERRRFTEEGIAYDSHGTYPKAMKELGKEENVPVIDLTEKSKALYEELGVEKTKDLFLWLEKGEHPNYPDGVIDNTHFQENGAREISHLVAEGVKELKIVPLKNYLNKEQFISNR